MSRFLLKIRVGLFDLLRRDLDVFDVSHIREELPFGSS